MNATAKQVKREYELGVFAQLRQREEPVDESWLRDAATLWLRPRRHADEALTREARNLQNSDGCLVSAYELPPLALACCNFAGAAAILVEAVNRMIDTENWHELALTFRQLEVWRRSMHRQEAELPWWELAAAAAAAAAGKEVQVSERYDLAARSEPGGADAPFDVSLATSPSAIKTEPSIVKVEGAASDAIERPSDSAIAPPAIAPPANGSSDAPDDEVEIIDGDKAAKEADKWANAIVISSDEESDDDKKDGYLSGDESDESLQGDEVGECNHCGKSFHYNPDAYESRDHCVQCGFGDGRWNKESYLICPRCLQGCDDCEMYLCPPCKSGPDEVEEKRDRLWRPTSHLKCDCGSGICRWRCCRQSEHPME